MISASIPSPSQSVWYIGPFPLRAYALAILLGIVAAAWITSVRWKKRGGPAAVVIDVSFWAVPFGIVGGRIYHVLTSPRAYFGEGGNPWRALAIWEGGMGIWGAIILGALGAYIGVRRAGYLLPPFADALAPGLLVAQAIGRLGNYFNQELFGGPTTLPWGLEISPTASSWPTGTAAGTVFHPTFLYEMVWNLAGACLLVWLDKKLRLGHGRVFALYAFIYCVGRGWIEMLRIDPASHVGGLRLNVISSIVVGLAALAAFFIVGRRHPGRETELRRPSAIAAAAAQASEVGDDDEAQTPEAEDSEHPDGETSVHTVDKTDISPAKPE